MDVYTAESVEPVVRPGHRSKKNILAVPTFNSDLVFQYFLCTCVLIFAD